MKPDCRRVLSQIASYSVEELSPSDADAFTRHLDDCPPCKGHWVLFEKTLTTLSHVGEADISVQQSQQMWLTCLEHAKKNHQDAHHGAVTNLVSKVEVTPAPFRSSLEREGDRRNSFSKSQVSRNRKILRGRERGGYARLTISRLNPALVSLGLSVALASLTLTLLGASWFFSPTLSPSPLSNAPVALPNITSSSPNLASFQVPPHATTGMIDYHCAMAFEPVSDYVGPTIVAYAATQSQ